MWLLGLLLYLIAPLAGAVGLLRNARPWLAIGYYVTSIVMPPAVAWAYIEYATLTVRPGQIVGTPVLFIGWFTGAGLWIGLMVAGVIFAFLGEREEQIRRWKNFPFVQTPQP